MSKTEAEKPLKTDKKKSNEEIFAGFQNLRAEQRQLANKISELEMDLNEHKVVIESLVGVEGTRKCFRMLGGVLTERTVADVLPELRGNSEMLPGALQSLNEQLTRKGQEINDYIERYDIRVQRVDSLPPEPEPQPQEQTKANVLVASG